LFDKIPLQLRYRLCHC